MDYDGIMGVPISFLDKYNPDQFEIIDLLLIPSINGVKKFTRILIKAKR
jgi:hypothetical protein